jgi:hypothetical protein
MEQNMENRKLETTLWSVLPFRYVRKERLT